MGRLVRAVQVVAVIMMRPATHGRDVGNGPGDLVWCRQIKVRRSPPSARLGDRTRSIRADNAFPGSSGLKNLRWDQGRGAWRMGGDEGRGHLHGWNRTHGGKEGKGCRSSEESRRLVTTHPLPPMDCADK